MKVRYDGKSSCSCSKQDTRGCNGLQRRVQTDYILILCVCMVDLLFSNMSNTPDVAANAWILMQVADDMLQL